MKRLAAALALVATAAQAAPPPIDPALDEALRLVDN